MLTVHRILTHSTLALTILGACRSAPSAPPVVGVAYPPWGKIFIAIAESTLRVTWGDTATLPRFVIDTLRRPESSERAVEWTQELLATPGITVIVGPSASHTALAVAPVVNGAGVPQIIPTATSRRLDQAGPWTFRLVPNDSAEAAFLVHQIQAHGTFRKALVVFVNDAYGQGLRDGLRDAFLAAGMAITAELSVNQQSDFELLIRNEMVQRRPDVVVAAVRNGELRYLVPALEHAGARQPLFVGDGAYGPAALYSDIGPTRITIYGATFWVASEANTVGQEFIARFQRITDRPPRPEDVMIHDALVLAATAARQAHGDPREARRWLLSLGRTRVPFAAAGGPIEFLGDRPRPFHLGRFVGDSAVDAELP